MHREVLQRGFKLRMAVESQPMSVRLIPSCHVTKDVTGRQCKTRQCAFHMRTRGCKEPLFLTNPNAYRT